MPKIILPTPPFFILLVESRLDELESTVRSEGGVSFARIWSEFGLKLRAIEAKLLPQADFQPLRFFLTEQNPGNASFAQQARCGTPDNA